MWKTSSYSLYHEKGLLNREKIFHKKRGLAFALLRMPVPAYILG